MYKLCWYWGDNLFTCIVCSPWSTNKLYIQGMCSWAPIGANYSGPVDSMSWGSINDDWKQHRGYAVVLWSRWSELQAFPRSTAWSQHLNELLHSPCGKQGRAEEDTLAWAWYWGILIAMKYYFNSSLGLVIEYQIDRQNTKSWPLIHL